jgi:hypothetical protein
MTNLSGCKLIGHDEPRHADKPSRSRTRERAHGFRIHFGEKSRNAAEALGEGWGRLIAPKLVDGAESADPTFRVVLIYG